MWVLQQRRVDEDMRESAMKTTVVTLFLAVFLAHVSNPAEALCVKVQRANIRSGPGTGHELVWEVYKYMPFQRVGRSSSGQWYAVKDVDGDVNWINRRLLTDSYRCGVVKNSSANVRVGPGTHYREARWSPAQQYSSFRILKTKGAWIKVKDEWGETGWIYKKLLWIK